MNMKSDSISRTLDMAARLLQSDLAQKDCTNDLKKVVNERILPKIHAAQKDIDEFKESSHSFIHENNTENIKNEIQES